MKSRSGSNSVIVVLGAALESSGAPGRALKWRLETAAQAFTTGRADRIIITGAGETPAMLRTLLSLGVPEPAILIEPTARSTHENARAVAALMRAQNLHTALVVTQKFHMRRALRSFTRAGVTALPLPAPGIPLITTSVKELVARAWYVLRRR